MFFLNFILSYLKKPLFFTYSICVVIALLCSVLIFRSCEHKKNIKKLNLELEKQEKQNKIDNNRTIELAIDRKRERREKNKLYLEKKEGIKNGEKRQKQTKKAEKSTQSKEKQKRKKIKYNKEQLEKLELWRKELCSESGCKYS